MTGIAPAPGAPPPHIPPPRLFRLLLATPRPILPLPFAFTGLPGRLLSVRALLSSEVRTAIDEASDLPPHSQASAIALAITTRALLADGEPLFASPDELADLPIDEADRLCVATMTALETISPIIGQCDRVAWHISLCEGAKDPSNRVASEALGDAYDIAMTVKHARMLDKPELYFGLPRAQLTDGHWLCYHAARAVLEEKYQ